MFGIGFQEVLIIGLLCLMIFGPNKLPEMARDIGRFVSQVHSTVDDLKSELNSADEEEDSSEEADEDWWAEEEELAQDGESDPEEDPTEEDEAGEEPVPGNQEPEGSTVGQVDSEALSKS